MTVNCVDCDAPSLNASSEPLASESEDTEDTEDISSAKVCAARVLTARLDADSDKECDDLEDFAIREMRVLSMSSGVLFTAREGSGTSSASDPLCDPLCDPLLAVD